MMKSLISLLINYIVYQNQIIDAYKDYVTTLLQNQRVIDNRKIIDQE